MKAVEVMHGRNGIGPQPRSIFASRRSGPPEIKPRLMPKLGIQRALDAGIETRIWRTHTRRQASANGHARSLTVTGPPRCSARRTW